MSVRNVTPVPTGVETYRDKFVRKFKEQPLVPIETDLITGAAATCFALITAMVKMRRGEAKSMNYWLRARVVFQGLTIAAIVGGSYAYGQTKQQKEARAAAEQDAVLATASKERAEFQERLRAAEEAHLLEEQMAKGGRGSSTFDGVSGSNAGSGGEEKASGWWSWFGGGNSRTTTPAVPKVNDPLPPPPGVSSSPAGADMVRSPVADASPSSSKSGWGWSSEKKP